MASIHDVERGIPCDVKRDTAVSNEPARAVFRELDLRFPSLDSSTKERGLRRPDLILAAAALTTALA
jgi:hypothetical protein